MTIKEAMKERHMVRKYTDKPIPGELVAKLNSRIAENNQTHHISLSLVTGNADGLGALAKMMSKGVKNYIILAGPDTADLDEKLGYCGADMILYAQTLGLNTWWVGGMFNAKAHRKTWTAPLSVLTVCWQLVTVRHRVFLINLKPQRKSAVTMEVLHSGLLMVWRHCFSPRPLLTNRLSRSRVTERWCPLLATAVTSQVLIWELVNIILRLVQEKKTLSGNRYAAPPCEGIWIMEFELPRIMHHNFI